MAADALTEPLLPRGRDELYAGPVHATVFDIAAATSSSMTTTVTRSPPPKLPSPERSSGLPLSPSGSSGVYVGASAWKAAPPTVGSPPPMLPSPGRSSGLPLSAPGSFGGDTGASASTAAPPTGGSSPPMLPSPRHGSYLPLSGSGEAAGHAGSAHLSPPSPSHRSDLPPPTGTSGSPSWGPHIAAYSSPSSPECSLSPSRLSARSSPRSTAYEILGEGVFGDPALRPAGSRSVGTGTRTSRLGFRLARGARHAHPRGERHAHRRTGLRFKRTPKQDFWSKESFIYMCVLMVFAGLVAYLGTMVEGWVSYLKVAFIMIFGVATGLACTGAMALISDNPIPSPRHFAPIVSRLTFLVASLAFEGAVFYLLGEIGFAVWLLVASGTVFGMAYFWRAGHPDSFDTLFSGLRTIPCLLCALFDRILALVRRS